MIYSELKVNAVSIAAVRCGSGENNKKKISKQAE